MLNGLLALGAVAVALGITELTLRVAFPQPTALSHQDPFGLGMHWPGMTRQLPQYGTTVSFNSIGMRDREHAVEKTAGVYRVLLFGDSFMEALQVDFEESFPSLLEQGLSRRMDRPVEVVSVAVSGWGTDDELRYLTSYGLDWRPDLVVVAMTLHNDISDNLREVWYAAENGVLVERPHAKASFLRYKVIELKGYLATRLQTYQLWRKVRHGREMKQTGAQLESHIVQLFREPTPERIASGYAFTGMLLARMQEVTQASGGHVALVLLPLRVQLTNQSFDAFVRAAGATAAEMPAGKPQRVMTEMADSLGMPVVDLLPAFRGWVAGGGADPYLERDGHWNTTGHRVASTAAVEGLIQAGAAK